MTFEGDVLLLATGDGGDIVTQNNLIIATVGLETAVYLSLFGGNRGDSGTVSTKQQAWWGNQLYPNEPNKKMVSRTGHIVWGLPATPGNIKRIESAVQDDLEWLVSEGVADSVAVQASIPKLNTLGIRVQIVKDNAIVGDFKFAENWTGQKEQR